ncbi:uncharacterized protein K02A2.6-like [Paramacrobiotus metropolitanus]|uniref:uncharacterized protein K02A2.6-like n=1 Tax=Paramacrobiotus metropolitanus TaxID=2943436 RepID=UPI002445B9B9|nr:uncharacterized protein K02A2.6-like [Paramacrobiotus metropolitanus]
MSTTGNTDGTSTSTVVRTSVTQTRQDVAGEEADSTGLPRLAKFDPEVIKLETWRIQFDSHLSSHGMATDRKKPLLLGSLAPKAMEMLASMCRPKDPGAFTFDELIKQQAGQTLLDFSNSLRNQAVKCDFPDTFVDDQLCAAFMSGVASETTRRYLYSLPVSSVEKFDTLYEEADKYEQSRADAKQSGSKSQSPDVAAIKRGGFHGRGRGRFRGRGGNNNVGRKSACFGCGSTSHMKPDCPHKNAKCYNCGKTGHTAKVCKAPKKEGRDQRRTNYVRTQEYDVLRTGPVTPTSIFVPLTMNGKNVPMELDTGSSVTIMSKLTWRRVGAPKLRKADEVLHSFTGHQIPLMGTVEVQVQHRGVMKTLKALVTERGCSIIGRDWISQLELSALSLKQLQQGNVCTVTEKLKLAHVLQKHKAVFRDELGCCKNFKAHLYLKENARPVFCKARPVPFALKEEVEEDIDRLVSIGVLTPVDHAEWAAPTVYIKKPKKNFRICSDLSTGLNDALDVHKYPLPHPDELFAKLNGGVVFCKIDLREAYNQIPVDDESSKLLVINTHKGLFKYNRLPFGVASAPSIFQQLIESILQGCERKKEFLSLKDDLTKATQLVHFNPELPLVLAADASKYGIGAVLSHRMPDGSDKPIAHISKTLTSAEQNYGQIEKEALGLVFGVKRFHQYLYGREFVLLTDHKPLVTVFGSKKGVPVVTANRLQQWAIVLMGYTFRIEYRRTSDFGQADGLSRLPIKSSDLFDEEDLGKTEVVNLIESEILSSMPVSAEVIRAASAKDKAFEVKKADTSNVIFIMESLFARYGLCTDIVSDNGRQFTSEQFQQFCTERGIKHMTIAPGHPQSNGQAERYVGVVKKGIEKGMQSGKTFADALREFLSRFRPDRGPPPPVKAEVMVPTAETKPPKKPSEKAAAKPPKVPKAPIPEAELRRSDRTRKMPDYLLKDYVTKKIFVEFPPI